MENVELTPDRFSLMFLHGERDIPPIGGSGTWNVSPELYASARTLGVTQVLVHHLARFLGCECEIEAVVCARNAQIRSAGFADYVKALYEDAGIFASVVDASPSIEDDDARLTVLPAKVLRLYQMDPEFERLLGECVTYTELKDAMLHSISKAVKRRGFQGIKSHIGEHYSLEVRPVYDAEASAVYEKSKGGDYEARKTVYFGVFTALCVLAQELDTSIHIHTGMTGAYHRGVLSDLDPFKLAHFLKTPSFRQTRIILLHSGYPLAKQAGLMAHAFPHVWVDMSWISPWMALRADRCIEDVLAIAPASKLVFGSGQHSIPEIAWLAARVARRALLVLGERYVQGGAISQRQHDRTAAMVLHENARRLYRL